MPKLSNNWLQLVSDHNVFSYLPSRSDAERFLGIDFPSNSNTNSWRPHQRVLRRLPTRWWWRILPMATSLVFIQRLHSQVWIPPSVCNAGGLSMTVLHSCHMMGDTNAPADARAQSKHMTWGFHFGNAPLAGRHPIRTSLNRALNALKADELFRNFRLHLRPNSNYGLRRTNTSTRNTSKPDGWEWPPFVNRFVVRENVARQDTTDWDTEGNH